MWVTSMTRVRGVIAARKLLDDVGGRGRRHLEGDLLDHDPVAARALVPGGDHPRVVLVGDDHLVAALEVEAEDHDLVAPRRRCG